jgi:hypothetical protein
MCNCVTMKPAPFDERRQLPRLVRKMIPGMASWNTRATLKQPPVDRSPSYGTDSRFSLHSRGELMFISS